MGHENDTVSAADPIAGREALLAAAADPSPVGTQTLHEGLKSTNPSLRAAALSGLARSGRLQAGMHATGLADSDPHVRRTAARLAPKVSHELDEVETLEALRAALSDSDRLVVIYALCAIGERQEDGLLEDVIELGSSTEDALVLEEAVACVAELGDPRGLPLVLSATTGKPALRRRSVAALGAFDGAEVETALDRLAEDRDWQVRQAVAMLRRSELD